MQITIDPAQVWFAFWFSLGATVIVPPKSFGWRKRALGAAVLFFLVIVYVVADNNLQLLRNG